MSDLVLARNCCLARMLPVGVGMNMSVREGKKCEAHYAVQRTGYCAIQKRPFFFTIFLTANLSHQCDYFVTM